MKIGAIAGYFGGKRTLAPEICRHLGLDERHDAYFGLCAGSLAVEFAKLPCRQETVVDMHGDVTLLAMVLSNREAAELLYADVAGKLVCEDVMFDAQARLICGESPAWSTSRMTECVRRAADYFVVCWMSAGGFAGTDAKPRFPVRWTVGGGDAATRYTSAVASIPEWHARMQGWTILRRDIFEVIPKIADQPGVRVYVDPTYHPESRSSGSYVHEFTEAQHRELPAMIEGSFSRARIGVSHYDCPAVRSLYAHWKIIPLGRSKHLSGATRRGDNSTIAPEILCLWPPAGAA